MPVSHPFLWRRQLRQLHGGPELGHQGISLVMCICAKLSCLPIFSLASHLGVTPSPDLEHLPASVGLVKRFSPLHRDKHGTQKGAILTLAGALHWPGKSQHLSHGHVDF